MRELFVYSRLLRKTILRSGQMGQPQPAREVRPDTCDVCPECHSVHTTVTIASAKGVYCRCSDCGHVWHQDRVKH